MTPLLSVIMPFHDAADFVAAAVESIRSQTVDRWELICIDDGSTDGSGEVVARLARRDARIRVVRLPRVGIVAALNHGLREAQGDLVARMDADDVSLPRRFEVQCARLEADGALAAVGGAYESVDARGTVWRIDRAPTEPAGVKKRLLHGNCLCHPAMLIRREALAGLAGPYRGQFPLAEDYDLWLRMTERRAIGNVPEVVLRYRRDLGRLAPARIATQAVAGEGARHAARARRDGRPDPAETWVTADRDTLERAGIPASRLGRVVRRALLSEARLARKHGFRESSRAFLRHAATLAPRGEGVAARLEYAWRTARVLLSQEGRRPISGSLHLTGRSAGGWRATRRRLTGR